MRTVSLEMAKKLKEAGLQHQITYGDWYLAWLPETETYVSKPVLFDYTATGPFEEDIWLPTLSDLLEWLEGRGYAPDVIQKRFFENNTKYRCHLWKAGRDWLYIGEFDASTREDAVGLAVLYVLGSDINESC